MGMAALATFTCTGITQVVLGGIQDFIFEDTGWSRSTIALAVTLGTWTSGLISPLIGRLADKHGPTGTDAAGDGMHGDFVLFAEPGEPGVALLRGVYLR